MIRETAEVNGNHNDFGTWVTPKEEPTTDLYLFGYGHRYREAVHALYRLTGPTPLLPRFVLGNWWSRYHRYTETEYRQLVERFEKEGIPFTTAVIDMDWHLVDDVDPKYGSGWTGYTWNKDFFPDPKRFLNWLHEHGMKATLNVHPRDGVRAFEELYPQVAKAMNIDPESGEAVQFDLTDPKFMEVYFDQLHHPMEEDGVDFWWIDWQQGGLTRQPGLDPLWGPEPPALPRFRPQRRQRLQRTQPASAHLLALRRPGLAPLPDRLLRRYRRDVGVAEVPAGIHRLRFQHRLRLVEPRHRRPHVRLP